MMGLYDPNFWINFWPGFWANLVSSFIVGILITAFISWIIKKRNKAEARILFNLISHESNPREAEFSFFIKNTGRVAFKENEIYWHIFVQGTPPPEGIPLHRPESQWIRGSITVDGLNFTHYSSLLPAPVFPGVMLHLFSIDGIILSTEKLFFYYLSTAHGYFPRHLDLSEDGEVILESVFEKGEISSIRQYRSLT
ncbi:MAG TPA: hypothetical protein VJ464_03360 [Blastocatellia bacterium]|nr:hypothetical protein [Blastocatellia bacterium]